MGTVVDSKSLSEYRAPVTQARWLSTWLPLGCHISRALYRSLSLSLAVRVTLLPFDAPTRHSNLLSVVAPQRARPVSRPLKKVLLTSARSTNCWLPDDVISWAP